MDLKEFYVRLSQLSGSLSLERFVTSYLQFSLLAIILYSFLIFFRNIEAIFYLYINILNILIYSSFYKIVRPLLSIVRALDIYLKSIVLYKKNLVIIVSSYRLLFGSSIGTILARGILRYSQARRAKEEEDIILIGQTNLIGIRLTRRAIKSQDRSHYQDDSLKRGRVL